MAITEIRERLFEHRDFLSLLNFIDPDVALSLNAREKIRDLHELCRYFPFLDEQELASEWRDLPITFGIERREFLIKLEAEQFWFEVCNTKSESGENLFPTLTLLVEAVFSIAHSNAEPERSFSDVNLVKDDMSTRTTTGFLNARCFLKSINKANNN